MPNRFVVLLRNKNFLFLTFAGAMSQLGDRLSHMLLITLIGVAAPGKLLAYSGGSLTFVLPTLILSPIAGVLVDHWDKRKTISRTHFIQTTILLLTPFAIKLTHSFTPFWVALTLFFGLDIFNNTANPALLPNLVASDKLLLANSVSLAFARIATVLGMVIGGFLIKWAGWNNALFIDASCHLIAGFLILNIITNQTTAVAHSVPQPHPGIILEESAKNRKKFYLDETDANQFEYQSNDDVDQILINALKQFFSDLLELIRLVLHNRIVAFVLASIIISTFISAVSYTILIYLVQQVLNMGTAGVGIFAGILAIGMIAGAAVMGLFPPNINRPLVIVTITILYGLLFFIGNWLVTVWFMIVVALIAGVAFSWLGIVQNTLLQEEVAPTIRGRVFSTREFVTNSIFLITTVVIGILGDFTSYRIALLTIGSALIVLGSAGFFWVRNGLIPARRLNPDD